jgi:hypothetical protein
MRTSDTLDTYSYPEKGNGICCTRFASITGNFTSTGYFCPVDEYPDRALKTQVLIPHRSVN